MCDFSSRLNYGRKKFTSKILIHSVFKIGCKNKNCHFCVGVRLVSSLNDEQNIDEAENKVTRKISGPEKDIGYYVTRKCWNNEGITNGLYLCRRMGEVNRACIIC